MHFFTDAIDLKQSAEGTLKTVLDEVHFIVNLYSLIPLVPPGKSFLPQGKSFAHSQVDQLPKLPSLDTSAIALVCMFSSNLSHS